MIARVALRPGRAITTVPCALDAFLSSTRSCCVDAPVSVADRGIARSITNPDLQAQALTAVAGLATPASAIINCERAGVPGGGRFLSRPWPISIRWPRPRSWTSVSFTGRNVPSALLHQPQRSCIQVEPHAGLSPS